MCDMSNSYTNPGGICNVCGDEDLGFPTQNISGRTKDECMVCCVCCIGAGVCAVQRSEPRGLVACGV